MMEAKKKSSTKNTGSCSLSLSMSEKIDINLENERLATLCAVVAHTVYMSQFCVEITLMHNDRPLVQNVSTSSPGQASAVRRVAS